MIVPKNVLRFEVLLYLSLLPPLLWVAFLDRDHGAAAADRVILIVVVMITIAQCLFVHLAARTRKNWARWALLAVEMLSWLPLLNPHGVSQTTAEMAISVISTALAAAGLYFSFTGDAQGWFNA